MSYATRPAAPRVTARLYTNADVIVVQMLAFGRTQAQIARHLGVPRHSVQSRLCRLYHRIGAENAPHAVALMIGAGVIRAPRHDQGVVA